MRALTLQKPGICSSCGGTLVLPESTIRSNFAPSARVLMTRAQAGQVDRILDAWRTTIPPQLEQMPGFCSVSALIDRTGSRAVSAVSYESREAMDRSAEQGLALRDRFAASMQLEITDVAEFDVVLAHLRVPETV